MAELIDKGAVSEEVKSLTVHVTGLRAGKGVLSKFMDEYRKSVLRIINEQPTTTEAEIRAKAYDRFLTEMLSEFDSRNSDIEKHTGSYVVSRLLAVAEQLKGE